MKESKNFKKVMITYLNGKVNTIFVDAELATIIQKLNNKGYFTSYCCSGHEEDVYQHMYILTIRVKDLEVFMPLIKMANDIQGIHAEIETTIIAYDSLKRHSKVIMHNPNVEEIEMAKLLVCRGDKNARPKITYRVAIRSDRQHEKPDPVNLARNKAEIDEIFSELNKNIDILPDMTSYWKEMEEKCNETD